MLAALSRASHVPAVQRLVRSRTLRLVGLAVASVPFVHLFANVDLSPIELVIHALDVGMGVAIIRALVLSVEWSLRGRLPGLATFASRWSRPAGFVLGAVIFFVAFRGVLPGSDAIHHEHLVAGYGDMAWRIVPVAGVLAYLAWASDRRDSLRREVLALREASAHPRPEPVSAPAELELPIAFPHADGMLRVLPSEIVRVEAMENYCELTLRPAGAGSTVRRVLLRATLTAVGGKLPSERFAKVHRSHLVQVDRVRAVVRDGRRLWIEVGDGERVPLARTQQASVLRRLGAASRVAAASLPGDAPA